MPFNFPFFNFTLPMCSVFVGSYLQKLNGAFNFLRVAVPKIKSGEKINLGIRVQFSQHFTSPRFPGREALRPGLCSVASVISGSVSVREIEVIN